MTEMNNEKPVSTKKDLVADVIAKKLSSIFGGSIPGTSMQEMVDKIDEIYKK